MNKFFSFVAMIFFKILLQFLLIYLVLVLIMYSFQDKLMYFPSHHIPLNWKMIENKEKDAVLGFELGSKNLKPIILFHGNSGSAAQRVYYKEILPKNHRIIIAEYPGFGANLNQEISKEKILSFAEELVNQVLSDSKFKKEDLIIVGESLGTGVASEIAKKFEIKKLVLLTPYSSILDVAKYRYWWLPVRYLLKDNFDVINSLSEYQGNTLVVLSGQDQVIPIKFGEKMFENLNTEKTKILVEKAGHTNWWLFMSKEQKEKFVYFFKESVN